MVWVRKLRLQVLIVVYRKVGALNVRNRGKYNSSSWYVGPAARVNHVFSAAIGSFLLNRLHHGRVKKRSPSSLMVQTHLGIHLVYFIDSLVVLRVQSLYQRIGLTRDFLV